MSPKKPQHEAANVKKRRCLMCSKTFRSTWNGERVCTKCKNGRAWRNGADCSVSGGHALPQTSAGTNRGEGFL